LAIGTNGKVWIRHLTEPCSLRIDHKESDPAFVIFISLANL
jgi:hypothetical protein